MCALEYNRVYAIPDMAQITEYSDCLWALISLSTASVFFLILSEKVRFSVMKILFRGHESDLSAIRARNSATCHGGLPDSDHS